MARTGRPRLENPRKEGVFIRLTQHTEIRMYAAEHNLTITQTLVEGFNALKKQEQAIDN